MVQQREQWARNVLHERCSLKLATANFNGSAKTAAKWVRRYRENVVADLRDRSSRPLCLPVQPSTVIVAQIERLRHLRWNGWRIAHELQLSRATVSRVLRAVWD